MPSVHDPLPIGDLSAAPTQMHPEDAAVYAMIDYLIREVAPRRPTCAFLLGAARDALLEPDQVAARTRS